jgi:hypothetical protein
MVAWSDRKLGPARAVCRSTTGCGPASLGGEVLP